VELSQRIASACPDGSAALCQITNASSSAPRASSLELIVIAAKPRCRRALALALAAPARFAAAADPSKSRIASRILPNEYCAYP
jgi:hypothetical protein